jgi:subtilase family serine protease
MRATYFKGGLCSAALALLSATAGHAAAPVTRADLAQAVDQGAVTVLGGGAQTMSVTLSLGLSDLPGAEAMMVRLAMPGDQLYHQFLTPAEIRASFGPSEAAVTQAASILTLSGLTVERATTTTLKVTGSVSTMERVFQTELHQFAVPQSSMTFHAAVVKPVIPSSVAGTVQGALGFSDAPQLRSNMMQAPASFGGKPVATAVNTASTGTPFGVLTVKDFAQLYDVDPVYARGITGAGKTLAIVTLAAFTPGDAEFYWQSIDLATKPDRITIVNVDGGPGAPSDASDSQETTLDVEQSGGIAPQSDIIVYQAPNTVQGYADAFAQAVEDNVADTMSSSWGLWEFFDSAAYGGVAETTFGDRQITDPLNGETVSAEQAMHQLFVLGALEGQSLFTAAADSGAFDTVRAFPTGFSQPLSVDYPGTDTAIVAAGGTTLPGTQTFTVPGGTLDIANPVERVWGWDYLEPLCAALGISDLTTCGIFSVGTGGGVSVFFPVPVTQLGLAGVQKSQPGQSFIDETTSPTTDFFDLPAGFAGRNVPDVEFNADPETGYEIPYTSDQTGFGIITFFGGTSFVAPQLNGVAALLNENAGHRFGLLTVPFYTLARSGLATIGPKPIFHTISTGDNWFYTGRNGFSPAGGLGTINVASLAAVLK